MEGSLKEMSKIYKSLFFKNYFEEINHLSNNIDSDLLQNCADMIKRSHKVGGKIIVAGNGGSASIASHVSIDLNKAAGIPCINFNESSLITCLANDFGYENWLTEAIKMHCKLDDTVILISSSGESKNILNAMKQSNKITSSTISLSGFNVNNKLSKLGQINLHVNSKKYNYVEIIHNNWLLSVIDYIINQKR